MVSEAFVRFFVEIVGHYSLFLTAGDREERSLQREAFRKAVEAGRQAYEAGLGSTSLTASASSPLTAFLNE